ncbi:MAG: DUF5690 family protein [Rhizomicrobium sp.]
MPAPSLTNVNQPGLTGWLAGKSHIVVGLYALTASFITYFCMYAFRKPFAVGTYQHITLWGGEIDFKIAIVIAQALGYAASKLIGIKVVAEAGPQTRARLILLFIGLSLLSLVLFAVLPAPLKVVAIFFSGLPLGMIWGLVFGYLEGRRMSEILGAGLCISFIVSSGAVKTVGSLLIVDCGVPEIWMPALTGALFFPLLATAVWFLAQTPPPDAADQAERMSRSPMYRQERKAFIAKTGVGLVLLILAYVVLTTLRDFRDNFAAEIWQSLGYADAPAVFSLSEIPVALIVLVLFAATCVIRDNRKAVLMYHGVIIAGAVLVAIATYAFQTHRIDAVWWMILVGSGIYVGYVPYNAVLVDRMTAATALPGNAAFFMYLSDASGYVGSVGLMLWKNFAHWHISWLAFFVRLNYWSALIVSVATAASYAYFRYRVFASPVRAPAHETTKNVEAVTP